MSLVIARDGKVFVVANAEYLTPEEAYSLGQKIKNKGLLAFAQREDIEKEEVTELTVIDSIIDRANDGI